MIRRHLLLKKCLTSGSFWLGSWRLRTWLTLSTDFSRLERVTLLIDLRLYIAMTLRITIYSRKLRKLRKDSGKKYAAAGAAPAKK
jgi:hypothetical protein